MRKQKPKVLTLAEKITANRAAKGDRSRNAQAARIGIPESTLRHAEKLNQMPVGTAGLVLAKELGVASA